MVMSELYAVNSPLSSSLSLNNKSLLDSWKKFNINNPKIRFLHDDFMKNLNKLLISKSMSNYSPQFVKNLNSLIIKWLLIKRQEYPNDQKEPIGKFKELFIETREMIYGLYRSFSQLDEIKVDKTNFHMIESNREFIIIECIRNWKNGLESRYKKLFKDIYARGSRSPFEIICKHFDLKRKFLGKCDESIVNSLLNSDPLLAFLLSNDRNKGNFFFIEKTLRFSSFIYILNELNEPYENNSIDEEHFLLKVNNSPLVISLSNINDESDFNSIIDGKHGIKADPNKYCDTEFFINALELFIKFKNLNWESIIKTLKLRDISHSDGEIMFHFRLKDWFEFSECTTANKIYKELYKSSIEYEEKLANYKRSEKSLSMAEYIPRDEYYKVLRVLLNKDPVTIESIKKSKVEFDRMDFSITFVILFMLKRKMKKISNSILPLSTIS